MKYRATSMKGIAIRAANIFPTWGDISSAPFIIANTVAKVTASHRRYLQYSLISKPITFFIKELLFALYIAQGPFEKGIKTYIIPRKGP
jgi:hypothetical protein